MLDNTNVLSMLDAADTTDSTLYAEVSQEKPFNKCLNCEYLGHGCSGPNLNIMTVERACEFLQIRRNQLGYTYQRIADITQLSLVTVKRILTGQIKDPGFLSMQALTFALVSDPNGKHPCAMHLFTEEANQAAEAAKKAEEALQHKEKEFEQLRKDDREKIDFLKEQVKLKDQQMAEKDEMLRQRYKFIKAKDAAIKTLSVLLFISVVTIIAALVIDRLNPEVGFFWLH